MSSQSKYYKIGAIAWLLSFQYYVVQLIVAARWTPGYSWINNTISDLANTSCGPYGQRMVCSPLHSIMNASFVFLGCTMVYGSYFLAKVFAQKDIYAKLGFACMAFAGIGTVVVGLFPENSVSALHIFGASLPFIFGNIGMILIGFRLNNLSQAMRIYTIISGVLGLLALILFITHSYSALGIGGMERIVSYPQSIWMTAFGAYLLFRRKKLAMPS